ncbi:hypothetical protein NMY22_g13578 [Coprinellus aureogranulatus]|nr:hypothetical protein NMY22_g13578 [Coprinellus aureogranulatus]
MVHDQAEVAGRHDIGDGDSLKPTVIAFLKRAKRGSANLYITADWPRKPSHWTSVADEDVVWTPPASCLRQVIDALGGSLTRLVLRGGVAHQILRLPPGLFPSLESCTLDVRLGYSATAEDSASFDVLQDCHALKRVALDTLSLRNSNRFALPWEQITHLLKLDDGDEPHFITQLLPKCSQLRWFGIQMLDNVDVWWDDINGVFEDIYNPDNSEDSDSDGPITLDNMKTLCLNEITTYGGVIPYPLIFGKFDFPNLRTLRMEVEEMEILGSPGEELFKKLKSFTQLGYLSLHVDVVGLDIWSHLLDSVPHLHTLHLCLNPTRDFQGYSYLFDGLAEPAEGTWTGLRFVPGLRTLILFNSVPPIEEDEDLDEVDEGMIEVENLDAFLEARTECEPENHLEKIVVYGKSPKDVADNLQYVQCIQKYVGSGGLVFERQVKPLGRTDAAVWMELDSEADGWEEAALLYDRSDWSKPDEEEEELSEDDDDELSIRIPS